MKRFILVSLLFEQSTQAITLVYNMKIRRVFVVGDMPKRTKAIRAFTAVPIVYKRDRHIVDSSLQLNVKDQRITVGSLFNFRYIPSKSWWLEATTGLEREHVSTTGTKEFCAARFGLDDILLSGGYNKFLGKQGQAVFYGLVGFPATTKLAAIDGQDTLVGTRFFSVGIGSELSYGIIDSVAQSLIVIFQNRFMHFFTRSWQPLLPEGSKVQPGNVTDLLFSGSYRRNRSQFEVGYNPTFFTHQAVILPKQTIASNMFVRQSAYVNFSYVCSKLAISNLPVIIGAGFSLAQSKKFDTKIAAVWGHITCIF